MADDSEVSLPKGKFHQLFYCYMLLLPVVVHAHLVRYWAESLLLSLQPLSKK